MSNCTKPHKYKVIWKLIQGGRYRTILTGTADMYCTDRCTGTKISSFCTDLINTSSIGRFWAFWLVLGIPGDIEICIYIYIYFFFFSFIIFEFL